VSPTSSSISFATIVMASTQRRKTFGVRRNSCWTTAQQHALGETSEKSKRQTWQCWKRDSYTARSASDVAAAFCWAVTHKRSRQLNTTFPETGDATIHPSSAKAEDVGCMHIFWTRLYHTRSSMSEETQPKMRVATWAQGAGNGSGIAPARGRCPGTC